MPVSRLLRSRVLSGLALAATFVSGLLFFGGCDASGGLLSSPPRGLEYGIEHPRLAPGDSTSLRLTNNRSSPVGYNLACSRAERKTSDGWVDANVRRFEACAQYLAVLKSGGTAAIQVRIDSTAEEGVYRIEARIELDSAPRSVFTDPFRVEQG
ncbi:hypothetical protein [Salinibacter ruber]|uniref:hypothetical protein n=1 Tax=Salinibacter ruber TaxID=146919 RepID=UPI002072A70D|nr:hypothetical protein [Salinibacter ruber]